MVEENISSIESVSWWLDVGDIFTEKDLKCIQEEEVKAKKVAKQIWTSRQKNTKIADFLSFLLQDIKDEWLISLIYKVFFTMRSVKNKMTYLKKNINSVLIVGFFAPFYKSSLEKFWLLSVFDKLYSFPTSVKFKDNSNAGFNIDYKDTFDVDIYLKYLKRLSNHYHDNIPIHRNDFLNLLVKICYYYEVKDEKDIQGDVLYKLLQKKLFGN